MKLPGHWAFHAIRSKRVCGARASNSPPAWATFCATAAELHKAHGSLPPIFNPPPELPAAIDNLLLQDWAASIFLRLSLWREGRGKTLLRAPLVKLSAKRNISAEQTAGPFPLLKAPRFDSLVVT